MLNIRFLVSSEILMKVLETFFPPVSFTDALSHREPILLLLAHTEKSQSFTVPREGDVFLAGDSCSMSDHVKPQLCVLV